MFPSLISHHFLHFSHLCRVLQLGTIALTLGASLEASEDSARWKYDDAIVLFNQQTPDDLEQAFVLLYEAYSETNSVNLRETIKTQLSKTYQRYVKLVNEQIPFFEDIPNEDKEDVYDKLAEYGDARGMRLKGLLLLEKHLGVHYKYLESIHPERHAQIRNDHSKAIKILIDADKKNDKEAASYLSEFFAYGLYGVDKDPKLAWKWLERGINLGSMRANEIMARVLWDADHHWNAPFNPVSAQYHIEKVKDQYQRSWKLPADRDRKRRENYRLYAGVAEYIAAYNEVEKQWMKNNKGKPGEYAKNYLPRFKQLCNLVTNCPPTPSSLEFIVNDIINDTYITPEKYMIPPDALLFGVVKTEGADTEKDDALGITWYRYDEPGVVKSKIQITVNYFSSDGDGIDRGSNYIHFTKTLIHELGHVYFSQRYPLKTDVDKNIRTKIYEGHATNMAYEYLNYEFYRGNLTPQRYAEMFCSKEYKEYFFWFRKNFLLSDGKVNWEKLDRYQRESGGEVISRTQENMD